MSERDGFEPGVPCWVDTRQPDPQAAVDFYTRLFGREAETSGGAQWGVDFRADDADATAERTTELGGTVILAPFDRPIGRSAFLADPQGATFSVSRVVPA